MVYLQRIYKYTDLQNKYTNTDIKYSRNLNRIYTPSCTYYTCHVDITVIYIFVVKK